MRTRQDERRARRGEPHRECRDDVEDRYPTFAERAHHLKAFDRRIGRLQRLEASDQADHLPQLAVIGLDNVVEIHYLPMLRVLRKRCPDCVKVLNVGYDPEDADLKIAYPRDRTS